LEVGAVLASVVEEVNYFLVLRFMIPDFKQYSRRGLFPPVPSTKWWQWMRQNSGMCTETPPSGDDDGNGNAVQRPVPGQKTGLVPVPAEHWRRRVRLVLSDVNFTRLSFIGVKCASKKVEMEFLVVAADSTNERWRQILIIFNANCVI
jgi:hypothetical protein